jgi:hypothetical protein
MGVSQRHGKGLVAQEFFDRCNINPCHNKVTCEGMPEVVKVEVSYLGPLTGPLKAVLTLPYLPPVLGSKKR